MKCDLALLLSRADPIFYLIVGTVLVVSLQIGEVGGGGVGTDAD
jgi:hypothetical protein